MKGTHDHEITIISLYQSEQKFGLEVPGRMCTEIYYVQYSIVLSVTTVVVVAVFHLYTRIYEYTCIHYTVFKQESCHTDIQTL